MLRPGPEALRSIIYPLTCFLKVATEQNRVGFGRQIASWSPLDISLFGDFAWLTFGAAMVGGVSAKDLPMSVID
jgi:hypothetical protein